MHAIPAESVKKIIEMNRNQEYPEKLEDYQVELMSTAALQQETSNADFERELRRMADDMSESSTEKEKETRRDDRRDRKGGDRKGGGDRRGRNEQRNRDDQRVRDEQRREETRLRNTTNNRHSGARNNPRRSSDKEKRNNQ